MSRLFPALASYCPHDPSDNLKQAAFLVLPNLEAFYGGAAGGGKSDALLAGALQYVDVPGYAAILFRRTYSDLALPGALMDRSQEWLRATDAHWNHERKTWTFPSGATLSFGYLDSDADVYRYQSAEFQYIGFDELTQFTEAQYTYLFSRCRRPEGSRIPLRMRSASNPGGIGHNWVKKRFVTERKRGVVFIPATLTDNPFIDQPQYVAALGHLHSETLRDQLLRGDWGAFEGAAYPDFTEDLHVVRDFPIPAEWERFESMDHGSTHETAWFVTAVDYDGNFLVFDEYFSPGLIPKHATEILARRKSLWQAREPSGSYVPHPCYPDPSIRSETGVTKLGQPASIESEYGDYGIGFSFFAGDRQKARRDAYLRIARLLEPDPNRFFPAWHSRYGTQGSPQLFVSRRCPNLIDALRTAPIEDEGELKGEAVQRKWESDYGHAHAALRYGLLARPGRSEPPEKIPVTPEELREDVFARIDRGEMQIGLAPY